MFEVALACSNTILVHGTNIIRLDEKLIFHTVGGPGLCWSEAQWLCSSGASFHNWNNGQKSCNWLPLRCESILAWSRWFLAWSQHHWNIAIKIPNNFEQCMRISSWCKWLASFSSRTAGLLPPLPDWPPAHGQGSLEQYAHSSCKQEDLF